GPTIPLPRLRGRAGWGPSECPSHVEAWQALAPAQRNSRSPPAGDRPEDFVEPAAASIPDWRQSRSVLTWVRWRTPPSRVAWQARWKSPSFAALGSRRKAHSPLAGEGRSGGL